ncbi:MAG: cell envelope integrity protein TolA, partial [Cyanobacteria bacterium J06628_3]
LVNGEYVLLPGNPVWLSEIGLGIGCERGTYQGITREWMYWYNESGKRFFTPEERITEAEERITEAEERITEAEERITESEQRRQEAENRAQMLAERLKALGVDPDNLC